MIWLLRIVGASTAPTSMALTRLEEPSTASTSDVRMAPLWNPSSASKSSKRITTAFQRVCFARTRFPDAACLHRSEYGSRLAQYRHGTYGHHRRTGNKFFDVQRCRYRPARYQFDPPVQ